MAQKLPIYQTRKFQYMIIGTIVAPFLVKGVTGTIKHYRDKKNAEREAERERKLEAQKSKQRKEEELLKSELRQKEAALKHQYDVEFETLRHQNKMEEKRASETATIHTQEYEGLDKWQPLAAQNLGQLVNAPMSDDERIKYLWCTYVQNRDIFVLYGPPGIGKSHEVVDLLAEITNGTSSRQTVPLNDVINLPYKALYYDKEPDDNEWKEKFNGREDLANIDRIPCRYINETQLLMDIKRRIALSPMTNYVIVIDPITNFDIKPGDTHSFVDQLAEIQEAELANGRNITFVLVAHAVKDPKGKYLSDVGGSKYWGESVKTVVSLMPYGTNDCLRKLTFDKSKNGKEVTRGTTFILRPENTPHRHHSYDDVLTNEFRGRVTGAICENPSGTATYQKSKRTGKLAQVTDEDAQIIFEMNQRDRISLAKIAESPIGVKYELCAMEVSRLINDLKVNRA